MIMAQRSLVIKNHLSAREIHERYTRCKGPVEKTHWQIIWLLALRDNPLKADEVAKIIGCTADWVRKLARRFNSEGPLGLRDKRSENGNDPLLNKDQYKNLEQALQKAPADGGLWNCRKVSKWISSEINCKVSVVTGWNYLRSLGYSIQVPRPRHKNAATIEEQSTFKKNSAKTR
jgi:transposase